LRRRVAAFYSAGSLADISRLAVRIVLCHTCWSWVLLDAEHCPDCHQPIDLSDPDPSPAELAERFGRVICCLGQVLRQRRGLPARGMLFGLTGGLLFLPDLQPCPNGAWTVSECASPPSWTRQRWWPFWRARTPGDTPREFHAGAVVLDGEQAVDRFLNRPGGVFVPRPNLLRAQLRGHCWILSRTHGCTLRLTVLSPIEAAWDAWCALVRQDPSWRPLSPLGKP
jgi:hypothetical protein